jgi:hypothetical protein
VNRPERGAASATRSDAIDGTVRLQRAAVATRRTQATVLVLPIDAPVEEPIVLSETAIDVWDEFGAASTINEVVARLADRYDASADTIRAGVTPLVAQLVGQGALVACA